MRGSVAKILWKACVKSVKKDENLNKKYKSYKRMWDMVPRNERHITRGMIEGVLNAK